MTTQALPKTELTIIADLIHEAQVKNMARQPRTQDAWTAKMMINDKLAVARLLVDVEIGDGA